MNRDAVNTWNSIPISATFGRSSACLKARINSFKGKLRSKELVEYWSCKSIRSLRLDA